MVGPTGGVASFGSWSAVGAGASLLPGVNAMSLDPPKLLLQCVVDCVLHIELNDLLLVASAHRCRRHCAAPRLTVKAKTRR